MTRLIYSGGRKSLSQPACSSSIDTRRCSTYHQVSPETLRIRTRYVYHTRERDDILTASSEVPSSVGRRHCLLTSTIRAAAPLRCLRQSSSISFNMCRGHVSTVPSCISTRSGRLCPLQCSPVCAYMRYPAGDGSSPLSSSSSLHCQLLSTW